MIACYNTPPFCEITSLFYLFFILFFGSYDRLALPQFTLPHFLHFAAQYIQLFSIPNKNVPQCLQYIDFIFYFSYSVMIMVVLLPFTYSANTLERAFCSFSFSSIFFNRSLLAIIITSLNMSILFILSPLIVCYRCYFYAKLH